MASTKEQVHISLVKTIERLGYPTEFGELIAASLGTEKQMSRMTSYIIQFHPKSAEEIADEMLAIKAEFERYKTKKISEHYNMKYNELLNNGLEDDDEDY